MHEPRLQQSRRFAAPSLWHASQPRRGRLARAAAAAMVLAACGAAVVAEEPKTGREGELLAVLRSGADADKAVACKGLAVHGTAAAVPELARLLGDPRLASWSRIALEAIPDPACDAALRQAAASLSGDLLVGVIHSLGIRGDAAAVPMLAARLRDSDTGAARASAIALGGIATREAIIALRTAVSEAPPPVRDAVAEACVVCAERVLAAGNAAEAADLCDLVRRAEVPRERVIEATRGAILARGSAGVPLLVEQLRSPDDDLFAVGLGAARELTAPDLDAALAAELVSAPEGRAMLLVSLLADRGGAGCRAAALAAATRTGCPAAVRLAAVRALGRIGDESCVPGLLGLAGAADAELAAAAATALGDMPGEGASRAVADRLGAASAADLPLLLLTAARRRMDVTRPATAALDSPDPRLRAAALAALGEVVPLDGLPVLAKRALEPGPDAEAAMKALRTACVRMPDRDACAGVLVGLTASAPAAAKRTVYDILGEVGGARAMEAAVAAARSQVPEDQDIGTRLLGGWMTIDAAAPLLELARTMSDGKYRARAYRGYMRMVRQFPVRQVERLAMCRRGLEVARTGDERRLILDALKLIQMPEAIALAAEIGKDPELRPAAREAARVIALKLGSAAPAGWEKDFEPTPVGQKQ